MIEHRPFLALGAVRNDWLDARLHFRVGDTGRAEHTPRGPLYVWNDDVFAPRSGFGLHAHRNVEIVTWVRSGAITHEDDAGNRARRLAERSLNGSLIVFLILLVAIMLAFPLLA